MSSSFVKEILLIALMFTLLSNGECISCYQCRSDEDAKCPDSTHVIDCPSDSRYCRKIDQKLIFKGETSMTTIRECAVLGSPDSCYLSKWVKDSYQNVCECDNDKCNATEGLTSDKQFVTALSIFALLRTVRL